MALAPSPSPGYSGAYSVSPRTLTHSARTHTCRRKPGATCRLLPRANCAQRSSRRFAPPPADGRQHREDIKRH